MGVSYGTHGLDESLGTSSAHSINLIPTHIFPFLRLAHARTVTYSSVIACFPQATFKENIKVNTPK